MIYGFFYYVFAIILAEVIFFDCIKLNVKKSTYKRFFDITWVALAVIAAFRYGVGTDTPNYIEAYRQIPKLDNLTIYTISYFRFSLLYILINSLSKSIYDSFLVLQIFQCTFFFFSLYFVLKEFNLKRIYILLFFYLFLYFSDAMSAMRESFAMSACFAALIMYNREKYVQYFIFTIAAVGFHTGALVFFILPLMKYIGNLHNKGFYVFLFTILLLFVVIRYYFNSLQSLLMFGDYAVSRYMSNDFEGFSFTNIIRNVLIIISIKKCLINSHTFVRKDYVLLAVLGCFLDMIASGLPIAYRAASYFQIFIFYSFFHLIQGNKIKRDFYKYIVIFLFFYQPVNRFFSSMSATGLDPYCSYFSTDKSYYNKIIYSANASDYLI